MLVKIRQGVFETNSSSTHSLSIVSADDFNAWKNNQLYFDKDNSKFITKDDLIVELANRGITIEDDEKIDEVIDEYEFQSYSRFLGSNLEIFSQTHTTKSGDVIVAFGEYGYDG